jgi:hypothetical protein
MYKEMVSMADNETRKIEPDWKVKPEKSPVK